MRFPSGEKLPRNPMYAGSSCAAPPSTGIVHSFRYAVGADARPDAKSTRRPSGVHPRARSPLGLHVKRRGSPPSAATTYTASPPPRFDVKAIHRPSGEICGSVSAAGVLVSRRASPPCRPTTQRSPPWLKAIWVGPREGSRRRRVSWAERVETAERARSTWRVARMGGGWGDNKVGQGGKGRQLLKGANG